MAEPVVAGALLETFDEEDVRLRFRELLGAGAAGRFIIVNRLGSYPLLLLFSHIGYGD